MENKAKKQIVVNVSETAKARINKLKEQFRASDKEFVDAVLTIINDTPADVIQAAVEKVTIEKQVAKVKARIAKLEEKIAEEQKTLVDTSDEEVAAEEGHD